MLTPYLQALDQWSLGILMSICTIFGVKELPLEPDPHWTVEKKWEKQSDGYDLLQISSKTIQEDCRNGIAKYIVFPQTYMAKQEVYADNIRVYSNEMDSPWVIKSFLDKPVISCDVLGFAKIITFKNLSYEKYFASIGSWPVSVKSYPSWHVFYNLSYTVVGILSLGVGILCLFISRYSRQNVGVVLTLALSITGLMYSHYPVFYIVGDVHFMHQLAMFSISVIAYSIIFEKYIDRFLRKENIVFTAIITAQAILSYKYQNTTQFFIVLNALIALFLLLLNSLSKRNTSEKRFISFFVFFFGFRDLYRSQIEREGLLHLSLLCLLLVIVLAYKFIKGVYFRRVAEQISEEKILIDQNRIQELREINQKIRQNIHDMKSPITSLNFMTSMNKLELEYIKIPLARLNMLVNNAINSSGLYAAGWFSSSTLELCITDLIKEKSYYEGEITLLNTISLKTMIFFDPDYFKVICAELIDNTIKNNSNIKTKILFEVEENETNVLITYSDCGVGISKSDANFLGAAGFSSSSTGLGIYNLIQKINSWKGDFEIKPSSSGFLCKIILIKRASL